MIFVFVNEQSFRSIILEIIQFNLKFSCEINLDLIKQLNFHHYLHNKS